MTAPEWTRLARCSRTEPAQGERPGRPSPCGGESFREPKPAPTVQQRRRLFKLRIALAVLLLHACHHLGGALPVRAPEAASDALLEIVGQLR